MALNIPKERIEAGDLTEYEIQYLKDRGRYPTTAPPKVTPLEEQDIPTIADKGGIVDEDFEEGWTNDTRRAKLAEHGLKVDGKKDDLIARLRRLATGQVLDEDRNDLEDDLDDDDEDED